MENSEQQTKIINLGKQLVQELDPDNRVDTLSRWMAHYVAEKITKVEQMNLGTDKDAAEKECFETILMLWKHRWSIPSGKRPLEEFEPLLKVLKRLDPENPEPYLNRYFDNNLLDSNDKSEKAKEMAKYIGMVMKIDKVARTSIEFLLQQAAQNVNNERTQTLLDNAAGIDDSDDILIIASLLNFDLSYKSDEEVKKKHKIDSINRRIEDLSNFEGINKLILENYKRTLESLK